MTVPTGKYRHYKGNVYIVVCTYLHEATKEPHVLYRNVHDGKTWGRAIASFTELVRWPDATLRPRFESMTDRNMPAVGSYVPSREEQSVAVEELRAGLLATRGRKTGTKQRIRVSKTMAHGVLTYIDQLLEDRLAMELRGRAAQKAEDASDVEWAERRVPGLLLRSLQWIEKTYRGQGLVLRNEGREIVETIRDHLKEHGDAASK